jgi:hypothetical protein
MLAGILIGLAVAALVVIVIYIVVVANWGGIQ